MKNQLKYAVLFVVALSSIAQAEERVQIQNAFGNSCSSDKSSGKSLEFSTQVDPFTQSGSVRMAYKIELGRDDSQGVNCVKMYKNSLAMEAIELRKAQIELTILERKLIQGNSSSSYGDDW